MNQNDSQEQDDKRQGTPWLAWSASGVGLLLAVGGIGYILWDGISRGGQPPSVQVEAERIVERQPGYIVEIRATNQSGSTAATVVIEGELKRDGQTIETSEATFDFIPGGSERRGGLYFTQDPRQLELEFRPKGYTRP